MISEEQAIFNQALYGVVVSLFFSIITFVLGMLFRKKMSFDWKYLTRFFLLQLCILIVVYAAVSLCMYLK